MVENAAHCRLRDDKLRLLGSEEVHGIVLKFATSALIKHLTKEKQVHVAITNEWSHCITVVNSEISFCKLGSWEVSRNSDVKFVVVKELGNHWSKHAVENVLAHEINRVFNNNNGELNELMHHESNNGVVVVEIRVTELDVNTVHNWVQVAFFL